MPGLSPSDVNIVDPLNSFNGNLGINAAFTGTFIDVSDYTTITVTARADQPPATFPAITFEWSSDGVTADMEPTEFGSGADTQQTVHSTIHARFLRIVYQSSGFGSTNVIVQTLLRKGSISGAVSRVGEIDGEPDAQIVNSVCFGERQNGTFRPAGLRDTNFWIVFPYPNLSNTLRQTITASSVTSSQFDFFGLTLAIRRTMTVFNDTTRGNLYLRFGSAATTTTYDYKIAPQATWRQPYTWIVYGGTVHGIWDYADGFAQVLETTTGTPL